MATSFDRASAMMVRAILAEAANEKIRWVHVRRGEGVLFGWALVSWPLALLLLYGAGRVSIAYQRSNQFGDDPRVLLAGAIGLILLPFAMRMMLTPTVYVVTERAARIVTANLAGTIRFDTCTIGDIDDVQFSEDQDDSGGPVGTGTLTISGRWSRGGAAPAKGRRRLWDIPKADNPFDLLQRLVKTERKLRAARTP